MARVKLADLLPTVGAEWGELDLERVERFRRLLDRLPAVVVFETPDGRLLLADGYHRLAASHLEGRDAIEADIRAGSAADALRYATAAGAGQRDPSSEPIEAEIAERYGPRARGAQIRRRLTALLQVRMEPDEPILAEGLVYASDGADADISDVVRAGSGPGSVVVVTERRVLWLGRRDERWVRELPYSAVTSYTEISYAHRYGLLFEHRPIERLHWVPAHRFLAWSWGNAEAILSVSQSFLAFSHRGTAAARAIREQLGRHSVAARQPQALPKVSRQGHVAELTAIPEKQDR